MVAFRGHFDGKALVPDEPLELPRNQPLLVRVKLLAALPAGVHGGRLLRFAGCIEHDDLKAMSEAIDAGCEKVNEQGA